MQDLVERKGMANDDNYSHATKRFTFQEVLQLLDDTKALARYFYNNPDFVATAQDGAFGWAELQAVTKGFEKGYYPNFLDDVRDTLELVKEMLKGKTEKSKITLYRGLIISDVEPDLENPGICWSYSYDGAKDWANELDIGDPEIAPCVLKGRTTVDNVDWIMTILLLACCPEEREIRIWDDSKIEVVDWEVL